MPVLPVWEKKELRAGEQVFFREEEKELVGAQDKLSSEETAYLVQHRGTDSQGALGTWYRENYNWYQDEGLTGKKKNKIPPQELK